MKNDIFYLSTILSISVMKKVKKTTPRTGTTRSLTVRVVAAPIVARPCTRLWRTFCAIKKTIFQGQSAFTDLSRLIIQYLLDYFHAESIAPALSTCSNGYGRMQLCGSLPFGPIAPHTKQIVALDTSKKECMANLVLWACDRVGASDSPPLTKLLIWYGAEDGHDTEYDENARFRLALSWRQIDLQPHAYIENLDLMSVPIVEQRHATHWGDRRPSDPRPVQTEWRLGQESVNRPPNDLVLIVQHVSDLMPLLLEAMGSQPIMSPGARYIGTFDLSTPSTPRPLIYRFHTISFSLDLV